MSDRDLQPLLNRYFSQKVQLHNDAKSKALAVWQPIVDEILQNVKAQDPRFDLKPIYSGSYYERTKTKEPNEFDIMLEIECLTLGVWQPYNSHEDNLSCDPPLGYTTVMIDQGEELKWKQDRCIGAGNLLSSTAVKSKFASYVHNAARQLGYMDRGLDITSSGPAVTLSINNRDFHGSIDLTLAIKDASWPEDADDWKGKQRFKGQWPSPALAMEIVKGGCHLVAKKPKSNISSRDVDFLWRYSFSLAEKKLFTEGSSGAAGTCRHTVLRILKSLREDLQLTPLTSYHLKSIMFYEYQANPSDTLWTSNQLAARVKSALRRLLKCLQERSCPHFFIKDLNLFDTRSFNAQRYAFLTEKVGGLLSNPCECISRLLAR